MEKFFDIVCRKGGLDAERGGAGGHRPRAQAPRRDRGRPARGAQAMSALEDGFANLRRHLGIVKTFGLPCVVAAVNRRPATPTRRWSSSASWRSRPAPRRRGQRRLRSRRRGGGRPGRGGGGRREQPSEFAFTYDDDDTIEEKITRSPARSTAPRTWSSTSTRNARCASTTTTASTGCPSAWPRRTCRCPPIRRAAERARGLRAAGARHPGLHGRGLARAAVRRHPADARTGQGAGRPQRRHRRRGPYCRPVLSFWGRV